MKLMMKPDIHYNDVLSGNAIVTTGHIHEYTAESSQILSADDCSPGEDLVEITTATEKQQIPHTDVDADVFTDMRNKLHIPPVQSRRGRPKGTKKAFGEFSRPNKKQVSVKNVNSEVKRVKKATRRKQIYQNVSNDRKSKKHKS